MCVCKHVCTPHMFSTLRDKKRESDPLKLWAALWVLGIKFQFSIAAASTLKSCAISPALCSFERVLQPLESLKERPKWPLVCSLPLPVIIFPLCSPSSASLTLAQPLYFLHLHLHVYLNFQTDNGFSIEIHLYYWSTFLEPELLLSNKDIWGGGVPVATLLVFGFGFLLCFCFVFAGKNIVSQICV